MISYKLFLHPSIKDEVNQMPFIQFLKVNKSPPSKKHRRERKRRKLPAPSNPMVSIENNTWKEFPTDLFETVAAKLPIASLFRFRTVCRKWNSFLSSDSFLQQYSRCTQSKPWFYTISNLKNSNLVAIYDPSFKKWHHLSPPDSQKDDICTTVASAGGRVCFQALNHFYVYNPLIPSSQNLIPLPPMSFTLVGMTLNGNSANTGYKIICLRFNCEQMVYDSRNKAWAGPSPLPPNIRRPLILINRPDGPHTISVDNVAYFLVSFPHGIVSYDTVNEIWEQFLIPFPIGLRDYTLAECEGRILLVGLVNKINTDTYVCIYELQRMTFLWKQIDRTPEAMCIDFFRKKSVKMTCLANKGVILVALRSRKMERLVSYDVASRDWMKVRGCTGPNSRKRRLIAGGIGFYPCLTASAE